MMSKIQQYGRPYVPFDADSKAHRKVFHEILKYKTFGRAPFRFWLESEQNNLIQQISSDLVEYYLSKEFGNMNLPESEQFDTNEIRTRPNPHKHHLKVKRTRRE